MEVYVESFTPQMSEDELSSSNIVAYSFCARIAPSSVDYDEMLQSCIERSASIVNALDKIGYKMWLLMAGFAFTPVQQSKFPNYSLFKAAEKCGLPRDNALELTFRREDRLRTAGLHEVRNDNFSAVCRFLSRRRWAVGIFTRRPSDELGSMLKKIYNSADMTGDRDPSLELHWPKFSALLAPGVDVVFHSNGYAHDKFRCVVFSYAHDSDVVRSFPLSSRAKELSSNDARSVTSSFDAGVGSSVVKSLAHPAIVQNREGGNSPLKASRCRFPFVQLQMSHFLSDDHKDRAAIATRSVVEGREVISRVFHDEDDGGWQFLGKETDINDAILVGLGTIVKIDPTVAILSDLQLGWCAWRTSKNGDWQRGRTIRTSENN